LTFQDERDRDRRRKSENEPASASAETRQPRKRKSGGGGEVGDALRTVYQRTINEDIPPEMLDLLGKLG
jgi:hypothetical protein